MRCVRFVLAASGLLAALQVTTGAEASKFKVLYSFCSQAQCKDGYESQGGLLLDAAGNLYGTTFQGGANGGGNVFELTKNGRNWDYRVLHDFCNKCGDGADPTAAPIMDVNGNLYGTARDGGPNGCGTVYELLPNADRTKWTLQTLYSPSCGPFENGIPSGITYKGAATGALYDGTSPLFGTTIGGTTGAGTIFELMPQGNKWKETDLYTFCSGGLDGCTDGNEPGQLIVDASGNLYGQTYFGGSSNFGTAFELMPDARTGTWSEQILYNFCSAKNCVDGANPLGPLVMDGTGNLFGTTTIARSEGGTIYQLSNNGSGWQETVLCTFFKKHCGQGYFPQAGMIPDASGNLFGTDSLGGPGFEGTVYEFSGGTVKTLHNFCTQENCADGGQILAPVVMDAVGNLFGTTIEGGGKSNAGTLFEIEP